MKGYISAITVALLMSSPAQGAANLLFILDSSNSMWGQVNGVAKIETAKSALTSLITDLPPETRVGFMAYGHRRSGDCGDVELLTPVAEGSAEEIIGELAALTPKGKTPIATSLEASAAAFEGLEGPKSVVLISDGIETCKGNPCAAAEALAAAGVGVRVHVVGFDLTAEERAQLECITEKGKGRYFAANSVEGFAAAVTEALAVAQAEPEPEPAIEVAQATPAAPAEPTREELWVEEFDGDDLTEPWTVLNPNPDNYIVEEGELLLLAGKPNGFGFTEAENLIVREEKLPRGDWDITATFRGEFRTGSDAFVLGLRKDPDNFLIATAFESGYGSLCGAVGTEIIKKSKGDITRFRAAIFDGCDANRVNQLVEAIAEEGATLTISKRGRSYFASMTVAGETNENGTPKVWTTARLTSLRSPGKLTLGVDKWDGGNPGETLVFIDRIEVVPVEGEE